MDPVEAHAISSAHAAECWPGILRGLYVSCAAVATFHLVPAPDKGRALVYVFGVLGLVASPALFRTLLTPYLAKLLKESAK